MKMNNRKRGLFLSYINTALTMVIGIILSSFYVRQLGSTEYGVYSSIGSFINYLVLLEFGTGTVMTRNLSLCLSKKHSNDDVKKNIVTVMLISFFLSFVIICVAFVFYYFIDVIYNNTMSSLQIIYAKKIFVFLLIYLVFSFLVQTMNGIVLAYENYGFSSIVSIVRTIIKTILVVFLIIMHKKAIMIAVVDMLLSIAIFIYTFYYCKKHYNICFSLKYFDKKVLYSALPLCFALLLQTVVNQANSNVDKFLISVMISPEVVTMYSVSLYVYSLFSASTTIPISLYAPQVVKAVGKGLSGHVLGEKLIEPSRLIVIIGGIILFGFISVGKQFIIILYGSEYIESWLIAIIIMIPMFINMSNGIIINVLDAINKRMVRSLALLLTTVLNIFLTVLFIKCWGPIGAAFATLLCTLLGQVLIMNVYYYSKLKLPIIYMFKRIFKGILIFQIIAMIISFVVSNSISNIYFSFFIGGFLFIIIFFVLYIKYGTNETELNNIEKICNKLKIGGVFKNE